MKDEIKEILDDLRTYKDRYEYFLFNNLSFSDKDYKAKILLDYITNLQEKYNGIKSNFDIQLEYDEELENKITNLQKELEGKDILIKMKTERIQNLMNRLAKRQDKVDRLKEIAHKMHLWIFLHSGDEQKVYDELGLTDEENVMLGYSGQFRIGSDKDVKD